MTQTQFAALMGVSQAMVSKWKTAGLLVLDNKRIDPLASFALLRDTVTEERITAARHALENLSAADPAPAQPAGQPQPLAPMTSRQEREHYQAQLLALKYAREAAQVVDAIAVEAHAKRAVDKLTGAMSRTVQAVVSKLIADFGIPAERTPALRRLLQRDLIDAGLHEFSREMALLAAAAQADTTANATTEQASA